MARLTLSQTKISDISPSIQGITELSLTDMKLSGGFGSIYKATIQNLEYAVKVFNDGSGARGYTTINNLIDKMDEYERRSSQPSLISIVSLGALPLFSFEGSLQGRSVKGYVTYFLDHSHYVSLDDILTSQRGVYAKHLDIEKRLDLVEQFCVGLQALERMCYIHADINSHNIFVDVLRCRLVIIDYDSGAITSGNDNIPSTWGKPNEWIAPEIREQIASGDQNVTVNVHTDKFAAMVGMHYLIFMQPSYCFLENMSSPTMKDYLGKYSWPNAPATGETYFNKVCPAYNKIVDHLKNNYQEIFEVLSAGLNGGYFNTNLRVGYGQILARITTVKNSSKKSTRTQKTNPVTAGVKKNSSQQKVRQIWKQYKDKISNRYTHIFTAIAMLGVLVFYGIGSGERILGRDYSQYLNTQKENLRLKKLYMSSSTIIRFENVVQNHVQIVFDYTLFDVDSSKIQRGQGYIANGKIVLGNKINGKIHYKEQVITRISFGNDVLS